MTMQFLEAQAGAGKVSLNKISRFMPHVIPADAEKFSIYTTIESNNHTECDNVIFYQFLNRQVSHGD